MAPLIGDSLGKKRQKSSAVVRRRSTDSRSGGFSGLREQRADRSTGRRSSSGFSARLVGRWIEPMARPAAASAARAAPWFIYLGKSQEMSLSSSALERFAVDSEIRQIIDSTLGKHAREQSADHDFKRRGRAVVRFHYEASQIDIEPLSIPSWFEHPRNGKREAITQFTAKSRKALLCLMASLVIEEGKLPLFITLTYPCRWPAEPETWKRHLDLFGQWIRYHHKTASIIWKLEPQERGTPHYHLMVFGISFLPAKLVARR